MNKKDLIQQYKATPTFYGVIQIKNDQTGQTFIDVAPNLHNRWGYYQTNLNGNFYHDTPLQEDWNALGADQFSYSVLWKKDATDVDHLRQKLRDLKAEWLDKLHPAYNQH
ncbi:MULTISPECIES: GIY-YIG nuclease family protein [Levilactobacillus]|uniref:GIY-YIG nuclease family protein n=1 Tax=Levilactobacillus TaxID=2767886 RepID=UPI000F783733|nr:MULTISPECIES: GIY-YIG nuclease family protein [Levilactobacillus]